MIWSASGLQTVMRQKMEEVLLGVFPVIKTGRYVEATMSSVVTARGLGGCCGGCCGGGGIAAEAEAEAARAAAAAAAGGGSVGEM